LLLIISVRQDNIHANALCDTKHRKYMIGHIKTRIFFATTWKLSWQV